MYVASIIGLLLLFHAIATELHLHAPRDTWREAVWSPCGRAVWGPCGHSLGLLNQLSEGKWQMFLKMKSDGHTS